MNAYTLKMLFRSIRGSLGRYLAILAIVALGVGFFAGLKSSQPAMLSTADDYMKSQRMYDFQLMSTLGLTGDDLAAFKNLEGVACAEGTYSVDALADIPGGQGAFKFMSLTEEVSVPVLIEGRMPENAGECLADPKAFGSSDIGRTITLSDANDEDTRALFSQESFTIVGLARSPRYISQDRGSTSLGSGSIGGFVLLPESSFSSEVYHEILLWCDFPGLLYSEDYEAASARMEPSVKRLLNRRGALRYQELRREADEEIDEAQAALDEGWAEYNQGAAEAQAALDEGREKLDRAQAELDAGRAQIEENRKKLDEAETQIPKGLEEIKKNRALLDEKEKELEAGRAELAPAYAEISANEAKLQQGRAQLEAAKALVLGPYRLRISAIENDIAMIQSTIDALMKLPIVDEALIASLNERLSLRQADLAEAQAALAAKEQEQFGAQEAELAAGEQAIADARAKLAAAEAEIAAGEQAIADGRAKLDAAEKELKDALAALPEQRRQLDAAETELEAGAQELQAGWDEYYAGAAQAETELQDGRQKLLDGEAELEEAKAEIDGQLRLEVYALDRDANSGYLTFENDVNIVDGVANAFPVFFALIAALVCVTTMTRMVNEERTQIGTLKAMGYSDGAIMLKYLLYSGSSALLGCVLGFFLGITAIPYIVWVAYTILYDYAKLQFYFSPLMYGLSLAVSVLGTVFVTWLACRKELAERPAGLIRPKAPGKGKRILLERITPLWRRLSFLNKVTIRNAFRYRQRVLMMLLGIGGCTALVVAGFGVKDSLANVLDYQYEEISLYDMAVTLDTEKFASDAQAEKLWRGQTCGGAMTWQENITLVSGSAQKSTRVVSASKEELAGVISLHDKKGELPFPGPGEAVITEKLSDDLGLKPGDSALMRLDDGREISVKITGVCDNYLSHYVYVCPETVSSPRANTALLQTEDAEAAAALAARLRSDDGISYVSLSAQERDVMAKSMASLDIVVLLLIVCSGALAFITLYNLTNINIMERVREIATVKVLGFYPRETASYILRENLMLSFLGAGLGLVLGKLLHRFVMELIQVEYMTYDVRIGFWSFAAAFAVTMIFAFATNFVMGFKLERVNMAESLKSVE